MRHLAVLPDQLSAQRFCDYLLTLDIEATVEEGESGWSVWVVNEDHLPQAQSLLEHFLRDPEDPRYAAASPTARQLRAERVVRERKLHQKFIDVRTNWAGAVLRPRPITTILLVISVAVFVVSGLGRQEKVPRQLWITTITFQPFVASWLPGLPEVRAGQVWRLFSPMFIHFNILHIVFNMLWLWDLGTMIETRRGSLIMLAVVLIAAIPSNLLQYAVDGPLFGGMSGVVYGLLAYAWIKGRLQPQQSIGIHPNTVTIMLIWLVLGFMHVLGPIANWAHLGGLAMGALVAWVEAKAK